MRYLALATDYDGTLAAHGRVAPETVAALERFKRSGRKLVLVTGRELDDVLKLFPEVTLFDRVVAENGALLYRPSSKAERLLGERPPEEFIQELHRRGVAPFSVGRVIVATWEPQAVTVLQIIHDLGLEHHVIFNKGALMVLPSGVNKATGLHEALAELGLSAHNTVAVGDAENDHALFAACECAVAVANSLSMVKKRADLVTAGDHGAGVVELIDRLIATDLREFEPRLKRHELLLGAREDGSELRLSPYGSSVLVAGDPGSGKTTFATSFLERLGEHGYQFCIVDPEGDYSKFEGAVVLGDARHAPVLDEVMEVLEKSHQNAVVSLLRIPVEERPRFFKNLFPRLQELRARSGRPHWLVLDETHHLLPAETDPDSIMLPRNFHGIMMITVHPDAVAPAALAGVETVVATGPEPMRTVRLFAEKLGQPMGDLPRKSVSVGEAIVWSRRAGIPPAWFRAVPPQGKRHRHFRKYAEGDLGAERSFYFRGPAGKLNLQAQNLLIFNQLADGVDDETWTFHLRRGDFSRWIAMSIKDESLAADVARCECQEMEPRESRAHVRAAIEERYTAPA